MTPEVKTARINKLIHRLEGSTNSLYDEAEALGLSIDDNTVTSAIDEAIFECSECGWWCEQSEESSEEAGRDEWTCRDCCGL